MSVCEHECMYVNAGTSSKSSMRTVSTSMGLPWLSDAAGLGGVKVRRRGVEVKGKGEYGE